MLDEKVKKTAESIDAMIQNAEKGPSGFWVEDQEGCGNPEIFPEFAEGLKNGKLVTKEHFYCPWNRTVLYGGNRDGLTTGCYHNCSIKEAQYLTPKMLKRIMSKFKQNMFSGVYSHEKIPPLINEKEIAYIELQKQNERRKNEKELKAEHNKQVRISSGWMNKYLNKFNESERDWVRNIVTCNYRNESVCDSHHGLIFFDPNEKKSVSGAEKLSYDEYIYIQLKSRPQRLNFLNCYINITLGFKGCIEKKNKNNICFKRIFVEGMFPDGECFDGKEDHVWMSRVGFEKFKVGDSVSFLAEVYRYIKTSNGKSLEFGLRNPEGIKKIEAYELPSDEQLMEDELNRIICEACYLREQCSMMCMCMRNPKELKKLRKNMKDMIKSQS